MRRKIARVLVAALLVLGLAACRSDADVASANLSKSADQFEVLRRVVFYNGITGEYMLTIEGFSSTQHYRVVFKPSVIVPDIDAR
jgi:hypothetical protein